MPNDVSRERKREEILRAEAMFRDDDAYAITEEDWRAMSVGMGIHNQGGPAVGFMAELPTPTVPRGMGMPGMEHGEQTPGSEHQH